MDQTQHFFLQISFFIIVKAHIKIKIKMTDIRRERTFVNTFRFINCLTVLNSKVSRKFILQN